MKKLILGSLVSLSFVSCMEVENPVCNTSNYSDLFQNEIALQSHIIADDLTTFSSNEFKLSRKSKGHYSFDGNNFEVCQIKGKTLLQVPTSYGTYGLYTVSAGDDSLTFPLYSLTRDYVDQNNIEYSIVTREIEEKYRSVQKKLNIANTSEVIIVEELKDKDIEALLPVGISRTFQIK